ncbi:MAG: MoxR family ATPase [Firmicutes bacterium]|nr:MoxR family ATPase [Bacillota bacterium]
MNRIVEAIINEIERSVIGKRFVIERVLMALLADGHILLDDVPGTGKTNLALAVSRALGMKFGRLQCTPDVLPSDITGFSVYDREKGDFSYRPGIVNHTNLLLADEINRTSSKTQSALLEAMEERQVSVDGQVHPLPKPFVVIATQNRVGTTGTQPLPYAQMDRFMVQLSIGYPDVDSQVTILRDRLQGNPLEQVRRIISGEDFCRLQEFVRQIAVSDAILEYIAQIARASRMDPALKLGISPRGALALCSMARSCAFMHGRRFVLPEDVREVFPEVCAHRVLPIQGEETEEALRRLLAGVPVPDQKLADPEPAAGE